MVAKSWRRLVGCADRQGPSFDRCYRIDEEKAPVFVPTEEVRMKRHGGEGQAVGRLSGGWGKEETGELENCYYP